MLLLLVLLLVEVVVVVAVWHDVNTYFEFWKKGEPHSPVWTLDNNAQPEQTSWRFYFSIHLSDLNNEAASIVRIVLA